MGNKKSKDNLKNKKKENDKIKEDIILDIQNCLQSNNYPFMIENNVYLDISRKDYVLNKEVSNYLEKIHSFSKTNKKNPNE